MRDFYDINEDFKAYVDKYANKHHLTVDEALTHSLVRAAYMYYREEAKNVRLRVDDK